MAKSMWTAEHYTHMLSLHSSEKLSTRFLNLTAGVCFCSATRAPVRSNTDDVQSALPVYPKDAGWG